MKYFEVVSERLSNLTVANEKILICGENIDKGSCLGGLGKKLKSNNNQTILNVGNSELIHAGVGMGMMMKDSHCILLVKQMDFMLLSLDQFVNTNNFIRAYMPNAQGSFSVLITVCDQGYQGPQSSLFNPSEFASLCNTNLYCLNTEAEVENIINKEIILNGFKLILVSQSLNSKLLTRLDPLSIGCHKSYIQYSEGSEMVIICFGFSLNQTVEKLNMQNISLCRISLFQVNYVHPLDTLGIEEAVKRCGKVLIIDNSKSLTSYADRLILDLIKKCQPEWYYIRREIKKEDNYGVNSDESNIDDLMNIVEEMLG